MAKAAIERGNADHAAKFAYDVGVLAVQWKIKSEWERHALRGKKNFLTLREAARAGNEGRAFNAKHHHEDWQAWADEIWAGNKNLSNSEVARRIAKKHGGNWRTIRRYISQDYKGMNWFRLSQRPLSDDKNQ
jgi:hypothetical protein